MWDLYHRDVVYLCVTAFVWRVVGCRVLAGNWSFELFFSLFFLSWCLGVRAGAACCVLRFEEI